MNDPLHREKERAFCLLIDFSGDRAAARDANGSRMPVSDECEKGNEQILTLCTNPCR